MQKRKVKISGKLANPEKTAKRLGLSKKQYNKIKEKLEKKLAKQKKV